jgi:hypothetical protein
LRLPAGIAKFAALFVEQGKTVHPIPYGLRVRGLGFLGIAVAQWEIADKGRLRWEVRQGGHKRYNRLIAGRISADRKSILDYIFLPQVPSKSTFAITSRILRGCPNAEQVAEAVCRLANEMKGE